MFEHNGFRAVAELKRTAKKEELLLMAAKSDPFYSGKEPGHIKKAVWFGQMFEQYKKHLDEIGQKSKPHIRAMHYWLQSLGNVIKPDDGKLYVNTPECARYTYDSATHARYQGTVDPRCFDDKKNPDPQPHARDDPPRYSEYNVNYFYEKWSLPSINAALTNVKTERPDIKLYYTGEEPGADVATRALQPYQLEVWCEKSTMDEILAPICEKYGVNYCGFGGNASITAGVLLMQRVQKLEKPTRIFYISDYDEKGRDMPIQVARYIQFWTMFEDLDVDVKLIPIALTKEQVEYYQEHGEHGMPQNPDKEGVNVELDALQALYPGELERIVTEHFEEYYDRSIRDEYLEYEKEAHRRKREANNYTSKFEGRIKDVRARINDVVTPYKEKIDQLQEELALELESHRDAFFALEKEVMKAAYEALPELPDVPEAHEPDVEESDNVLFDSTRDYFEQTKILRGAKVAKPPKTRKKRSKKAVASSE